MDLEQQRRRTVAAGTMIRNITRQGRMLPDKRLIGLLPVEEVYYYDVYDNQPNALK